MNSEDLGGWALLGIAVASVATTLVALLVVRRLSNQAAIGRVKAQAQAHMLEFRLFIDDPAQILRSQRALVLDNLRLMRLLLPSFLILAGPMLVVFWGLDAFYSRAPLRVGEAAVISVQSFHSSIATPEGIVVETKPLLIQASNQTSWRIRPVHATSGTVAVASMQERIAAGSGIAYLPASLVRNPAIQIGYPRATVFGFHWLLWFVVLSTIAAFVLRGPLEVVF